MTKRPSRLLGFLTGAYATRRSITGGPGHDGPRSDHFDGRLFFNPGASAGKTFSDVLRWQRTRQPARWPEWVENVARPAVPERVEAGHVTLTFINHVTFLVQFRGLNVLTDPVYSQRCSPVQWTGPKRVRAPGLAFDALPHIDVVLLSHNHYDHLDLDTLIRLEQAHQPLVITTLGNRAFLEGHGLARVVELDWWAAMQAGAAKVVLTPAQHWSGRGLQGRNRTLWGGFVILAEGQHVYFAGDAGYSRHFAAIRKRLGPMDVALLPIGAYEPRWFMKEQHMNPDEAVRAHLDLEARLSIGTHFGCFQLTDEGFDDPVRDLAAARSAHGVADDSFRTLEVGETLGVRPLSVPGSDPSLAPLRPLARGRGLSEG